MDYILTTISNININENNVMLVNCKKQFGSGTYKPAVLLFPYGLFSFPKINDLVLLYKSNKEQASGYYFAMYRGRGNQSNLNLQSGQIAIGDFSTQQYIKFSNNITEINGNVNIGGATGLALNDKASLSITIPSGSSAGVYNVDVNNAGQNLVNI